jgi:hypothetical protein
MLLARAVSYGCLLCSHLILWFFEYANEDHDQSEEGRVYCRDVVG